MNTPVGLSKDTPHITGLTNGEVRPLWSVMIPCYKETDLLEKALTSVLMQALPAGEMQIEVVADQSGSADARSIVERAGGGRVAYFGHPEKKGPPANFNSCITRARGRLIHILHADDMVRTGFYELLGRAFETSKNIGAAFTRSVFVDRRGHPLFYSPSERDVPGPIEGWKEKIFSSPRVQASSVVVRRKVYETIGGFNEALAHCNDWDMWKRIAADYPVWYEPEPLAEYRYLVETAHSYGLSKTGENIREMRRSISISSSLLPPDLSRKTSIAARRECAVYAFTLGCKMLFRGDPDSAGALFRESFFSSHSPVTIAAILCHLAVFGTRFLWRSFMKIWRSM